MPILFRYCLLTLLPLSVWANDLCTESAIDELAADTCETTDKLVTCAEVPVDPDAIAKRFDSLMNRTETDKEKIQKYFNNYKESSALMQFFHIDSNEERSAKSNNKPYPRHILDWFTNSGQAADIDREAFKATMKEKYVEFAKKNDCSPVIKQRHTFAVYPEKVKGKTEQEIRNIVKAPNFEAEKNAYFDQRNAIGIKHGSYCEKRTPSNFGPYYHVSEKFPPCAGNVTGVFKDNQWTSSTLDEKLAGEATDEVVACIKDRISKGANIHHISVVSSASALNNTGEAAKKFCKKGFLALSEARAKAAKENVLPILFSKAGANASEFEDKIQLSYRGSNGDGTSGPCPYKIVNGQEVLKDEFKTAEGKKSLDSSKYIRIHVTFDSKTVAVNNKENFYEPHFACRSIYFECAPK